MEILYFYDEPQIWVDTIGGELRLFTNWEYIEESSFDVISGKITPALLAALKNDTVYLDDMWKRLTGYRGHVYTKGDMSLDYGTPIPLDEALEMKPFGHAYLGM